MTNPQKKRKNLPFHRRRGHLLLITLICLILVTGCFSHSSSDLLSVHMIDVGQGDSLLIMTPGGHTVLIDAGDPAQGDRVAAYLKRQGVARIDHFVLTHPHADHIGGAAAVLDEFPVAAVYMPAVVHTSHLLEDLLMRMAEKQIPLKLVRETKPILDEDRLQTWILSTGEDFGDHLNNWSLVIKLVHGQQSFLFTGDAESEAEEKMLEAFPRETLQATILKAGHHGSQTSTTEAFLDTVRPEAVLISCGEGNPFGHPHPSVLQRLMDRSIWIYRTDLQGTVVLYSDGQRVFSHQSPVNLPLPMTSAETIPH